MSKIDHLESDLWYACVRQRAPRDENQADRWRQDELAHLRERFVVTTAPPEFGHIITGALAEWDRIEAQILALDPVRPIDQPSATRADYLAAFAEARESFLEDRTVSPQHLDIGVAVRGAVRNMDWVNLFAWVLPGAVPDDREALLDRARMVVATYYFEMIGKAVRFPNQMHDRLIKKLEAQWKLVTLGETDMHDDSV